MQTFLEFEKPIQHVIEQIEKLKEVAAQGSVDVQPTLKDLEKKPPRGPRVPLATQG